MKIKSHSVDSMEEMDITLSKSKVVLQPEAISSTDDLIWNKHQSQSQLSIDKQAQAIAAHLMKSFVGL